MNKNISEDFELIVALASSSASLAKVPGKNNWIEHAGGQLPGYVRKLARGIQRGTGKTLSQAIAIAISRIKRWAAGGGGVTAKTRAKAAKALAEWEALKAKNKSRKASKKVDLTTPRGEYTLVLSAVDSYKLNDVESAWYSLQYSEYPEASDVDDSPWRKFYLKEVWTDFIIVGSHGDMDTYKIPYFVDSTTGVTFEDPIAVRPSYVEVDDEDLDEEELQLLADVLD